MPFPLALFYSFLSFLALSFGFALLQPVHLHWDNIGRCSLVVLFAIADAISLLVPLNSGSFLHEATFDFLLPFSLLSFDFSFRPNSSNHNCSISSRPGGILECLLSAASRPLLLLPLL